MHLNTAFGTDDNTEQFKLHTTDTYKRKRITIRRKLYKKDSSIDILTQYTIFLITSCFFFWLRGFLTFLLERPALATVLFFETDIPFTKLTRKVSASKSCSFLLISIVCSDSPATNQCLFVFLPKSYPLKPRNHAVKSLVPGPSGNTNIVYS